MRRDVMNRRQMQSQFNNRAIFLSYPTGAYMGVPPQPPRGHFRMQSTVNRPPQQDNALPTATYSRFISTTTTTAPIRPAPSPQTTTVSTQEDYSRANGRESTDQTAPQRGILRSPAHHGSSYERSQRHVKFSKDVTCIQHQQLKGDGSGAGTKSMRVGRHGVSRINDQRLAKYNAVAGARVLQYDNANGMSHQNGRANQVSQGRRHDRQSVMGSRSTEIEKPRHDDYVGNGWHRQVATHYLRGDDEESMITHRGGRRRSETHISGSGSRSARRPFIVRGGQKEAMRRRRETEQYFERNRNGSREAGDRVNYEGRQYHDTYARSNDRARMPASRTNHAVARQQLVSTRYQPFARAAGRERTRYH